MATAAAPPRKPIATGQTIQTSTFDPNSEVGNPVVESSSTTAIWDESAGGSVLVSKDSGKTVLDEPVITGTYEVDHLDDKTLDELPVPVGHVWAEKLNSTTNGSPKTISLGTCSEECCSKFSRSVTPAFSSAQPTAPVTLGHEVSVASYADERLFDNYVAEANMDGIAELLQKWEAASKRLTALVERAKSFRSKSAPPATGMVVGGPTAMSKAGEPTGVVDTGTGMTGIEGAREATGGAGQTKSILIETRLKF